MTITVGTDTYGTVLEADDYFSARFGFDKWSPLTEPEKEKALVSAAQHEDLLCSWYGYLLVSSQAMAFPRTTANPTPDSVKNAQFEIAYSIIDTNSKSTIGKAQLKVLKAKGDLEWFQGETYRNPLVNDLTMDLLSPYGVCSGSGSTTFPSIARS